MDGIFPGNAKNQQTNFLMTLREWLYELSFSDRLFLNAGLIVVLIGFYFLLKRKLTMKLTLPLFILADLIAFSWTQLPVTGFQMKSPSTIEHYFSEIPKGIPIPRLLPLKQNQFFGEDIHNVFGCWSYYSKQPGTPFLCNYPTGLNLTASYFNSKLPDSLNEGPFLFTKAGVVESRLKISSFSPSAMEIQVQADSGDSLILLQNYYTRWKSRVNGKPVHIEHADLAFMAVPLDKGDNNVSFYYSNRSLLFVTLMSITALISFTLFAFKPGKRKIA
jgi:hypothetical protein